MGKMFSRSRWPRRIALLLLVGAALGSLGDRALAVQGGAKVLFGPIGVARHEGVRMNVYAIGNPDIIVTRTTFHGTSFCESSAGAARSPRSSDCSLRRV